MRGARARTRCAAWLGALGLFAASGARADGTAGDWLGDYRIESRAWNGLAAVAAAAAAAGCPIEARAQLAWDRLEGTDLLWFLYPRSEIDPEALALFLGAGGRVVIADDYGAADAALGRLGIERRTSRPEAGHHFHDRPDLPEAVAVGETPLGRTTATLPTNHPAWFETALEPTFRFLRGAAVVEGRLGRGRFVALSDPSVLINNMQEIEEDRRFASGLIRGWCRAGVDRIVLVTGGFTQGGRPLAVLRGAPDSATPSPAGALEQVNRWVGDLDELLARGGERGDSAPSGLGLAMLSLGAALLALGLLGRALPGRGDPDDGSWTRIAPFSSLEPGVLRGPGGPWKHTLPAALLRDEVQLRLAEALERPVALLSARELSALVAERFSDAAAARAEALWTDLGRLRGASGASAPSVRTPPGGASWTSRRELERLHRLAVELFDALDEAELPPPSRKVLGKGA